MSWHRDDGPAIDRNRHGTIVAQWYCDDRRTRFDRANGTLEWYNNGKFMKKTVA